MVDLSGHSLCDGPLANTIPAKVRGARPAWMGQVAPPAALPSTTPALPMVTAPLQSAALTVPVATVDQLRQMHDLGFSLFPLKNGTKVSAGPWKQYQTQRASWAQVEEWRAQGVTNFGIATGAVSGLFVLDLDNADAVAEAERRGLPDTLMVKTPRGQHVYFNYSDGHPVRNEVQVAGLGGADIRGDGGYVVAVGSHYTPTPDDLAKGNDNINLKVRL